MNDVKGDTKMENPSLVKVADTKQVLGATDKQIYWKLGCFSHGYLGQEMVLCEWRITRS